MIDFFFFFSSRRRHTRYWRDWSSDVCSSDLKNDRYNTKYARLIEKNGDESKIIAEGPTELQNQIHEIIGLTVDDFTRSVVLPQGKFSEFLKLGGREKRNMLERIFALEK